MPNFKIFQDVADQARIKVYGNQNLPLAQDNVSGNVLIDGTVTVGNTVSVIGDVTVAGTVTVGNTVSVIGDVTVAGTVTVGNTVSVIGDVTVAGTVTVGNTVSVIGDVTVAGTVTVGNTVSVIGDVTVAGTVTVGNTVTTTPTTTNSSLSVSNFSSTSFTPSTPWDVLDLNVWTIGVINDANSAGDAEVQLQVSPDNVYYVNDSTQTISPNNVYPFFANSHMRYARVNYRAISGASAVTLNFYYQGHS